MEERLVLSSLDDAGVLTLTLNRPESLNAWIPPMHAALFDAFDDAADNPEVRVIVLTGAGRGFCPGADMTYLGELAAAAPVPESASQPEALPQPESASQPDAQPRETRPITHALSIPKPVICAINGACAGIGLAIAMSCDIRFVANEAKLTTAFAKLGLVAEHGLSWTLPQACGYALAKELLFTGRRFSGEEAAALGVVHAALPGDELLDHTMSYARQLARQCSPISFATIKWQLGRTPDQSLNEALQDANAMMGQSTAGPDFAEGVAAFTGRRDPSFAPLGAGTRIDYPTA